MKKENAVAKRKSLWKFIGFMILSGVAGFFGALLFDVILNIGAEHVGILEKIVEMLVIAVPIMWVLLEVLVLGFSGINYAQAKKMAAVWDKEDEDVIEKIESKLGIALTLLNILMVFHFFFFSATIEVAIYTAGDRHLNLPLINFTLVMMLLGLIGMISLSVLIINLEKRLNPEKQGDALDLKFNKEWMASCDEAQQKMIHEAGYRAFKVGQNACLMMWLVTLFGQFFFQTGIFPVVCVFVIYLTLVLSYSIASIKLEIKKSV